MFENLSLPHILMVLVIVMLVFGAKRIPEIAGSMGKGIREFKKNIHDGVAETLPSAPLVEPASPRGRDPRTHVDEELRTEPKRLLM